jgi:hypothetical protein
LPFDVTVTLWLAGFVPPCTPENVTAVGLTVRVGEGAVTVNVTGMETGVALAALTVTSAVYGPAVSEPVVTVTVIDPLPLPAVEERCNQDALSLTVHAPFALMVRVWVAGLAAPCVAV